MYLPKYDYLEDMSNVQIHCYHVDYLLLLLFFQIRVFEVILIFIDRILSVQSLRIIRNLMRTKMTVAMRKKKVC